MTLNNDVIKIFVGADRSQLLAFKVLEHSIKRNTSQQVKCRAIDNSMMPECKSKTNLPYTNFSFARFGIPSFAGYQGKAIYLDADMLVLADIADLWSLDFAGAKILTLEQPREDLQQKQSKKRKQTAVMMLDCEALKDWVPEEIIGNLGKKYDRTKLMSLDIFPQRKIKEIIPTVWNCMDWYEEGVSKLVHYTKIETQPWVYPKHPCGNLWLNELRLMLKDGKIEESFIRQEVALGYIRPSILIELGFVNGNAADLLSHDAALNFQMHKEMLAREKRVKRSRFLAIFSNLLCKNKYDTCGG